MEQWERGVRCERCAGARRVKRLPSWPFSDDSCVLPLSSYVLLLHEQKVSLGVGGDGGVGYTKVSDAGGRSCGGQLG